MEAASKTLKNLTKSAPDFLPAWILLARIAATEKKYDEALQLLENVFSRDERNVDARVAQSDFWLAKGEGAKAIEELERIDKAFPGIPTVQYRLAQGYLQQNNAPQAAAALDQALARNPDYTEAILLRAQLNVRTGHLPPAISALENLLKKQPSLKQAQLLLADAYRDSGQLDAAAAIFTGQIKADPTASQPYLFLGLIQQQQKKTAEARQSFEKVLEVEPDNVQAVNQLVALDLEAKDFDSANRRVQQQMEKHPKDAAAYLLEGKARMAQQQWKEAEAAAKKALELNVNEAAAYEMLVSIYLATNRLPEAVRELETVVSKAPRNASALMILALTQEKQKDYPKAREAYEKVLEINPDFVPALNNLSYIYAEHLNQLDKANEMARKARTVAPADPSVADTLGWVLFKRGDYQQALTFLQESADKVPGNPEIKFHLGMAHYMMGQADAARTAFQQAIAATGDFPNKSEAQNRLALLGDASAPAAQMNIAQLEELLVKQPKDLVARIRLAEAYEKQGAWTKATDAYEAAFKLNPKLASAALKLAQLFSGPAANKEKALAYAKAARALSPQDPKTTAVLGRVAFATGDFTWAYSLLQESSRQLTSDPIILHDFAWAAYSLGKIEEARKAMLGCVAAAPTPETAKDAHLFLDLTADPSALSTATVKAEIDSTLKLDPKYVPALMGSAMRDLQGGNGAQAVARFSEVLRAFPEFAPAQFQLAALYGDDPAHAAEAYDLALKARKSLPDDPAVAQLLGQLSYRKKEYPRAVQLLEESASKKPLDGQGLYYLAVSYREQKDPAKAEKLLAEAIGRGLPPSMTAEAEHALADLKNPKIK
jgi:tetratricopeptide (TPR) repeat protein